MNSTSVNTCSSICSMQPYSTQNQHQAFRYFSDSKRPLVVSFRRVNKVQLPKAFEKTNNNITDRCNSICDIHRIVELDANDSKMSLKSRYSRRLSPYPFNSHFDMRQRTHFDDDEDDSPQHDKISITYPKEKFHGNAKLLFTINDDILKHNKQCWYDSSNLFNATIPHNSNCHQMKKKTRNESDVSTNKLKCGQSHKKSSSSPSLLYKLQNSPSIDIEMNERKQNFVSILNVRANETFLVRNAKSY